MIGHAVDFGDNGTSTVAGAVVATVAIAIAMTAAAGWAFMIAVGVVRGEWLPNCPTIGFWPATLIAGLIRLALSKLS